MRKAYFNDTAKVTISINFRKFAWLPAISGDFPRLRFREVMDHPRSTVAEVKSEGKVRDSGNALELEIGPVIV